MELKHIVPYTFERNCAIANGYLKKQTKGRGSIGSEILEKISEKYSDLSLTWLVTGNGTMFGKSNYGSSEGGMNGYQIQDEKPVYLTDEKTVRLLREKVAILESSLADKEKIIRLLEGQLSLRP